jgi:curved DNA-binding protein CbpA
LRRAYRRRASELHPDHRPDAGDAAAEEMATLNAAWRVLGDPGRRRDYDATLIGVGPDHTSAPLEADDEDDDDLVSVWPDRESSKFRRAVVVAVILLAAVIAIGTVIAIIGPGTPDTGGYRH